jgi:ferrous iron transport protein B
VLLHPWLGPLILFALLFVVFQAVFTGPRLLPMRWRRRRLLGDLVRRKCRRSLLRDLLTDGIIAASARSWCSCRRS